MSSIGGFTFLQMRGEQLSAIRDQVIIIDRSGVDGAAVNTPAEKAPGITKQTIEGYTSSANALAAKAAYEALLGTFVTVVDDMGATAYNVLITDVSAVRVVAVGACSDASVNYLVYATWQMQESQ